MEDYLMIALSLLVLVFVICNPIVVAILIYLCNRTQKYLVPAIAGVCVHVASFTLFIFIILLRDGDDVGELLQSFEGEYIALYFIAVALNGLIITAAVLLAIRERRLNQTAPSKLAILFLLSIAVIVAFSLSSLSDDFGTRVAVFYKSATQVTETEFQGYKVYLGESHISWSLGDSMYVEKLNPGFGQVDDDFRLDYSTGAERVIKIYTSRCQDAEYNCEPGEGKAYQIISRTYVSPDEDYTSITKTYFNPKCDVYLQHSDEDPQGQYTELVERFFNNNCA